MASDKAAGRTAVLVRFPGQDQGTFGMMMAPGGFRCHAMELPDRGNRQNASRIPPGEYLCTWHRSPKFGWVFWVRDVPDRSSILMHPLNLAGDVSKGWRTHSLGCVGLGRYRGKLNGQAAVMASRPAVRDFNAVMGQDPFLLKIIEV
jgi:hypothetical protein